MMSFAKVPESNYRFFVTAMQNKKPERMPLYEHHIDAGFIQKDIHEPMVELLDGSVEAKRKFFRLYVAGLNSTAIVSATWAASI